MLYAFAFLTLLVICFVAWFTYNAIGIINKIGCIDFLCGTFFYLRSKLSSHSQFHEDAIIAYIFQKVNHGFYIDIGANDPNICNVTKYFYDRGWNGINIEANSNFESAYQRFRPNDKNLFVGISDKHSTMYFYNVVSENTLSTFDNKVANTYRSNGLIVEKTKVHVCPLNALLKRYKVKKITFMSIDAEGYELNVLKGMDFYKYRPAVMIIEATYPCTYTCTYNKWEYILLRNRYVCVAFIGVNRYYLDESLKNYSDVYSKFVQINKYNLIIENRCFQVIGRCLYKIRNAYSKITKIICT